MSLLNRAIKSMRHHRIATSMLFFYHFFFLSCLLFSGCFMLYLLTSKEQINSSIETIKEHNPPLYAQPFEDLLSKTNHLFLDVSYIFILLSVIGVMSIICTQFILFHFRKHEYRSYLLLNEHTNRLCRQIAIEQLIVLNTALVCLMIVSVFFRSHLYTFLSRIESSSLISQPTKIEDTTIQSVPDSASILDEHGFTRFRMRPVVVDYKNEHIFNLTIRHQFPIVASLLNLGSYCLIYFSNYVLFYTKRKKIV